MELSPYLINGDCADAFKLYEKVLPANRHD
jgi:hypothetical protein